MEDPQQTSTHFTCSEFKCINYYILGHDCVYESFDIAPEEQGQY
jgi:hypothetical protein